MAVQSEKIRKPYQPELNSWLCVSSEACLSAVVLQCSGSHICVFSRLEMSQSGLFFCSWRHVGADAGSWGQEELVAALSASTITLLPRYYYYYYYCCF